MQLICFSLVWFPSFKTDINLLSREAFLGAEQMPAESWNLTLSQQPAGSMHPLLWRVWVWGQFTDLHPVRVWPVTCPSACCLSCVLLSRFAVGTAPPALPRVLLQVPPPTPEQGLPAPAQHHAQLGEGGWVLGQNWGEKGSEQSLSHGQKWPCCSGAAWEVGSLPRNPHERWDKSP